MQIDTTKIPALEESWEIIKKDYSHAEMKRIESLVLGATGKIKERPSYPLQKVNSNYYIPGLTAKPWHKREMFSWIKLLEDNSDVIRNEYESLLARKVAFSQYQSGYVIPSSITKNNEGYPDTLDGNWNAFFLRAAYRRYEKACEYCPATDAILNQIPVARESLFSILDPGSHIKPHSDHTNFISTCHLGLIIPNYCGIKVGGEARKWREGECLVFDSSFLHEAWNSDVTKRVVFIIDFWHPDLTPIEINLISRMRTAFESFFGITPRNEPSYIL
jgi:aspartyl/asparaginyl beta-hydroxylase (cupin superfamily)